MKKLEKMSLANLQGKLTRKEMKSISGGSGGGGGSAGPYGYWSFNTSNQTGSAGGLIGQTVFNLGVAIVNTAAWIGNVVSTAPAPTPSPKK